MNEEHKGSRCLICFWALYNGTFCQGPDWRENKGRAVMSPVRLTSRDAERAAAQVVMGRVLESKADYRRKLAKKPIAEKLRILEQMAERDKTIHRSRSRITPTKKMMEWLKGESKKIKG